MKRNNLKKLKLICGVFALLISSIALNACSDAATERAEEVGGVTAQKIIENPNDYVGKTVTVSGNVEEIYDPRAFDMDSTTSIGNLLVLGAKPFPKIPNDTGRVATKGDIATVTGVVKMMTTKEDIEREIGWDLSSQIETTYKTKPVLIATDTSFRAGTTLPTDKPVVDEVTEKTPEMAENDTVDKKVISEKEPTGPVLDFADFEKTIDRKSFVGKRVNLRAINVESVAGDRTFFVGTSPSKRVLVVFEEEAGSNPNFDGKIDIDKGQKVSLEGIVRLMPSPEVAKRQFGDLMTAETLNSLRKEETYIYTDDPRIVQGK